MPCDILYRLRTDCISADALRARTSVILSYWPGRTSPISKTPKSAPVRFRTLNQEQQRPSRVSILSGTSGKWSAPLQAAPKAVAVLVVEDDWMIREDIVIDLRQQGWAVLEAATGAGALKALQDAEKEKVDLLITDIGLAAALGRRRSIPKLAPRGAGDLCFRKRGQRPSSSPGERVSQQAGRRFRAYRDLPQASGAAGSS